MLAETKPPAGPSRGVCDVADPGGSNGFRGGAKGSFIKLHNVLKSSGQRGHRVKLDIHRFWIYLVTRRKIDHVELQKYSLPLFLLVAILSGLRADSGIGHAPSRALVSGLGLGRSLPGSDL